MNKSKFSVGQLVRVKGYFGKFRYVGKNIVREIKSGKCISVSYSKIRSANFCSLEDISILMLKIFIFIVYPLFILSYLIFN